MFEDAAGNNDKNNNSNSINSDHTFSAAGGNPKHPAPSEQHFSQTLLLQPLHRQTTEISTATATARDSDSTALDMSAVSKQHTDQTAAAQRAPEAMAETSSPPPVLPGTTGASRRAMRTPSASLFGTLEFKVYYAAYLIVVPNMVYTMYRASSPARDEYAEYKHELSDGWMFGRMIDLTDGQWHTFRSNLPAFAGAMAAYVVLNGVVKAAMAGSKRAGAGRNPAGSILPALVFPCLFATCFVVALSGTSAVFILALALGNYAAAKTVGGRRWAPAVFWTYNMAMLFANEHYRGYEFGRMAAGLAWLDEWRGILRRWDVTFNLTMLRMVSFAMDYHWRVLQERTLGRQQVDAFAVKPQRPEKQRIEQSCAAADYSLANYWAYLTYPPLYLTGPIITFNNFVSQMRDPPQTVSWRLIGAYGARLVAAVLLMETVLHTVHCVAISKWGQWDSFSAYEISLIGYMRLTFIWLKLLIIWRFARFWALADGVETVENMRRCMSNNYSLQQFWRDWHCSYNRWLVRYVYIPLGGRRTSSWNTFVVFTFVALWHDLSLRLLQWAWLIALLFLPEALATWVFARPRWARSRGFRFLCSAGGAVNIIAMMVANLVGFGDDSVAAMVDKVFSRQGLVFLAVTWALLNVHLQMMFELREHEYRREYAAIHGNSTDVATAAGSRSKRQR
ncbi:glycerol transporter [Coemansia sp. RSA 1939]|nr:glycerol transporter [Coemansia sp. RSA 1939]